MASIQEQLREIKNIWSGFQSSRVLLTANNYRVFDYLEKQASAKKLALEMRTDSRATEILLDALAGLGLLKKQNNQYMNTPLASRFLVSKSPYYQGDIIKHADGMWNTWSHLDRVMKTGEPCRGARDHEAFILGMHNLSVLKAGTIIDDIGLTGVKKALDLGGGPGTYSIEMARRGVQVTLFDAPETEKIAHRVIRASGADKHKIIFRGGDFLSEDIGRDYDLILVSQIFHAYSGKQCILLLKKCRKALSERGRVVIHEFLINEKKTHPVWSSLFAINMLVNTEGGRTYTPNEIKSWFLKAGFKHARKKIVADGVLVSARK